MIFARVIFVAGILLLTGVAQECPDPPSIFGGACVETCSSDTDCTNGQICCSNGCGHDCMTPVSDPCATVRCAAPNCSELSTGTIIPEGQCCPVCACSATDGTTLAAGTSYMNDCNTCSCLDNGLAICTLIACVNVSTTAPSNTTSDPTLLPTSSPMMCPNATGLIGTCDEQCSSDDECGDGQLCCSNGCGHACMNSVPDCSSVTCLRADCEPPGVLFIPTGSCCPICAIPDTAYTPETTEMPTNNLFHTCPTLKSNDDNDCFIVDECFSNDDCQYERICCSNGCGGHVCSDPVELCQVVDCAWPGPTCEDGTQPEISPFRCCPFCPSESEGIIDDGGGTGVITVATLTMVTLCCFLTFLL